MFCLYVPGYRYSTRLIQEKVNGYIVLVLFANNWSLLQVHVHVGYYDYR